MIRTLAFSLMALAVAGTLALAQDAGQNDFSDVDAALEALTQSAAGAADTNAVDGETEAQEVTPLIENTWIQNDEATLRGLDKITGRSTDFTVTVGEPKVFGSLEITLATCFARPPEQAPENSAFLTVSSVKPMEAEAAGASEDAPLFSGWMFASSPGLNALEHSVYDVWVIACGSGNAG